jgi:tripartite-type tricarboxylate transporter receptor subunit TctC
LLTELLKSSAGIDVLDVPYKGGSPATTDVMGGQVDMLFSVLPLVLPYIKAGKLRALAVASDRRSALIPDVPTMREAGYPDVTGAAWNGLIAPAGVPAALVAQLNAQIAAVLASPDTRQRFQALGMEVGGGTPNAFATFLRDESSKWERVVKAAKIRPE